MFSAPKYIQNIIDKAVAASPVPTERKDEVKAFLIEKCGYSTHYPRSPIPKAVFTKYFSPHWYNYTYVDVFGLSANLCGKPLTEDDLPQIVYDIFETLSRKGQRFYKEQ